MTSDQALVAQHAAIYEKMVAAFAQSYQTTDPERGLAVADLLAYFAWHMHPGFFTDMRLERWTLALGRRIWADNQPPPTAPAAPGSGRRVLHVVTRTYPVGGHTRLLWNIVRNDAQARHDVAVLQQRADELPPWLGEAVADSGGNVLSLVGHSLTRQTALLQQALVAGYNHIFYHVHPNDSVAAAALAAVPRPQVLFINHADHAFWLGATAADVVVAIRDWSLGFSLASRGAQQVALLPIPLNFPPFGLAEKAAARRELHLADDQVLLLSVASAYKFTPSEKYNYFRLVRRVLDRNPHVIAKIVGVSPQEAGLSAEPHERFEFLGNIEKPNVYYQAADIYIDSMPFASFTSLLEAMYFGCYPVLQFSPASTLQLDQDVVLRGLVRHARDEDEEVRFIEHAASNPDHRREVAQQISQSVQDNYLGAGWQRYLDDLYALTTNPVQEVRALEALENAPATIVDEEAAVLSRALFGKAPDYVLFCLLNGTKEFSLADILRLYRIMRQSALPADQRLTLRHVLYFTKAKAKKKLTGK